MITEIELKRETERIKSEISVIKYPKHIEFLGEIELKRVNRTTPVHIIFTLEEAKELRDFLNQLEI
jgi:hypothetical protein